MNVSVGGDTAPGAVTETKEPVKEVKSNEHTGDTRGDSARASTVSSNDDGGSSDNRDTSQSAITVEATAYTAFCNTGCIGKTATGVDVSETIYHEGKRIIAVDPDVIPLGSHVTLTFSSGETLEATAQDTGGNIDGSRIDLLVNSTDEAFEFGRQNVEVTVH